MNEVTAGILHPKAIKNNYPKAIAKGSPPDSFLFLLTIVIMGLPQPICDSPNNADSAVPSAQYL